MRAAGRDISGSLAPVMASVMPSQSPRMGSTGDNLEPSPWHHEPVRACRPKISAVWDGSGVLLMGLGQEGDREGEVVS